MKDRNPALHLSESLAQLAKAMDYLRLSLDDCSAIEDNHAATHRELALYEALASRFARASDMLVNKVFRALDAIELYEPGSPLDVLNRADKRALFDDIETIRSIRRVRNRIAHEYNVEDFPRFMGDIRRLSVSLIDIFDRTKAYAERLISSLDSGGNQKRV